MNDMAERKGVGLARDEADAQSSRAEPDVTTDPPTILVAEDDKVVQTMVDRMLGQAGYVVLTADDGSGALELLEERGAEVHLFVADVVLPQIPGDDLAAFAIEHFREMAVLFISGHPQDEKRTGRKRFPNACFLAKPFTPEELLTTVRDMVGVPPTR